MSFLEKPSEEEWEERHQWFETTNDEFTTGSSSIVSEHATALIGEVENSFCAGAWISVIVLALSAIDAQLREIALPGFKGSTKKLIEKTGLAEKLDELRDRRNSIVHSNPESPTLTWDDVFLEENRDKLKEEAEKAIELMLEVFYLNPGE